MSQKFGYESVEEYQKDSQAKFSLLQSGMLDQPSTRLLLINVRFLAFLSNFQLALSWSRDGTSASIL